MGIKTFLKFFCLLVMAGALLGFEPGIVASEAQAQGRGHFGLPDPGTHKSKKAKKDKKGKKGKKVKKGKKARKGNRQKASGAGGFVYRHAGASSFKGSLADAEVLLGIPREVASALAEKIARDDFRRGNLRNGDLVHSMVFTLGGQNVVERNFLCQFADGKPVPMNVYEIPAKDGSIWIFGRPDVCWNWATLDIIPPTTTIKPPEKKKEQPPPPPPEKEGKAPICIEHEPTIGAGYGASKGSDYVFAYLDYIAWIQKCGSEYAGGIGVFANGNTGDTTTGFEWGEPGIFFQPGIRRLWTAENGMPRGWQVKGRIGKSWGSGGNDETGYSYDQDNWLFGGYAEYVHRFNEKWLGMVTLDWWYTLSSHRNSTLAGEKPETRDFLGGAAYLQYDINKDWAVRVGGGPFHQFWDDLTGLGLKAEARYKETLMFGPFANVFPFGVSDVYKAIGTTAGDLTTYGGFVRLEGGKLVKKWDEKRRADRVKAKKNANQSAPAAGGNEMMTPPQAPSQNVSGTGAGQNLSSVSAPANTAGSDADYVVVSTSPDETAQSRGMAAGSVVQATSQQTTGTGSNLISPLSTQKGELANPVFEVSER